MAKEYMTALKARIQLQLSLYSQIKYQTVKAFCKMDKLKILQWNCRGLNNKISDLILFSAEKDIDVICLNEVKNWKNQPLSTITSLRRNSATTVIMALPPY